MHTLSMTFYAIPPQTVATLRGIWDLHNTINMLACSQFIELSLSSSFSPPKHGTQHVATLQFFSLKQKTNKFVHSTSALIYPTLCRSFSTVSLLKQKKFVINCKISFLCYSLSVFIFPMRLFGEFHFTYLFFVQECVVYHVCVCVSCVYCCAFCLISLPLSILGKYWHMKIAFKIPSNLRVTC